MSSMQIGTALGSGCWSSRRKPVPVRAAAKATTGTGGALRCRPGRWRMARPPAGVYPYRVTTNGATALADCDPSGAWARISTRYGPAGIATPASLF